jgi:hypothetical protein
MTEDKIIKGIYKNHIYCCGEDLGELNKDSARFCGKCGSLYFYNYNKNKERKITEFTNNKKEIEIKAIWLCPKCKSNSVALDPQENHKHYGKGYKDFEILFRCCNCQMQFLFKYQLIKIKIH